MSTSTSNLQYSAAADANYRQWVAGIETAILAAGWTVSTETGDIGTIASATVPIAGAYKFRVYKMADSLQSTSPVFMKIRYGRSASGNCPAIGVQFGTGSNGSGTLTGYVSTEALHSSNVANASTSTFTCYFSGDTNRFMMCLWESQGRAVSNSSIPFFLQVERSKDNTGADTGEYLWYIVGFNGSSRQAQAIFLLTNTAPAEETGGYPAVFPTTRAFNNFICVVPAFPIIGCLGNPCIMGFMNAADITHLSVINLNYYGVSHTLIAFSNANGPFNFAGRSNDAAALLRYE
jgi:hypothetical protein